ncbi:MAG TPA: TrkA family potassium uptake protein [Anaerolineae bacterium]|nr:TrkA family potassium uptake protein [Anaerolineae bacterium]
MNVLIVGCGRVGAELAVSISQQGHAVTIVDMNPGAFERLGPDFKGRTVQGFGFDRSVLQRAGIEAAQAFATTTASDNANIIAAKIARDIYKVPNVVARIYNPARYEVYERMGLQTVASSSWGAQRIQHLLLHPGLIEMELIGHGEVKLLEVKVPAAWVGRPLAGVLNSRALVVAVTRAGRAFVPRAGETFQTADLAYLSLPSELLAELEAQVRTQ